MKKWNWNNPVTWKQIFTINFVSSIVAVVALASLIGLVRIENVRAGFRNKKTEEEDN